MGVFATIDDVEARYEGEIPPGRAEWVEARINDAEGLLTALIPSLLNPSRTGEARSARAKTVVCDAVLRVYRNPGGFRSEGMETDNASRSPITESGQLQFTPDELQSLRIRARRRGLGTIKVAAWNPVHNAVDAVAQDWPVMPPEVL